MLKEKLIILLILNFLQNFIVVQCYTPPLNYHAVVIASEFFKPRKICEGNKQDKQFGKVNTTNRLEELRKVMISENISAYIILSADEHQSETVSEHDKRLKFISGFSGSNGIAVVTLKSAALWTDSRYYIQADDETDCNWIVMRMGLSSTPSIEKWLLSSELKSGDFVSSDPKILSYEKWNNWKKTFEKNDISMKVVRKNLIDEIWTNENGRPDYDIKPIQVLDVKFAGMKWEDKLNLIRDYMRKNNLDAFVFSALDEIAWALNLRGSDISYFPVFYSYLIVQMEGAILYVSEKKITWKVIDHLNSNFTQSGQYVIYLMFDSVGLHKYSNTHFKYKERKIIMIFISQVPEDKISMIVSPALLLKDYKNPVEIAGMKSSHVRDGLVVCQFLSRLEKEVTGGSTNWTELKAVEYLDNLRTKQKYNAGISFGTISAFGKNAASAHYQPTPETDTLIDTTQVYMLDSGGQYYDGTTDCTRTVHFGEPRDIEKEVYTRLLMGCIDLATLTFKEGYTLKELEIMIRAPLYEAGLDYGHGSTHGIGSYLAVHEGIITFNTTYHINFFGSQEPGYYKEDDFGMRLENIVTVVKSPVSNNSKTTYLTFETVTLIPYEKKLIKVEMLDKKHINWLNDYHRKVRKLVGNEMLNQGLDREYEWLLMKTEPITHVY
ncbi:Xaa-Pro aminopeptidase 2 precursor, putative [Pediculus humanus corporis]|uniref:Xaa-Pro aminopeptidase 2, putative n=1 Tax=Pediculus humanus subsp. corporis TaxID=121224 RepID=E0VGQ5_PEDHC|nr:Xaa-Pro aminopeptidase 2 precursor, putative [Pediculus humanus corporis]EEB12561.1 Xaa-Pro aminopeptidase 2 precursor, putative [Pediculus humanus corporis]